MPQPAKNVVFLRAGRLEGDVARMRERLHALQASVAAHNARSTPWRSNRQDPLDAPAPDAPTPPPGGAPPAALDHGNAPQDPPLATAVVGAAAQAAPGARPGSTAQATSAPRAQLTFASPSGIPPPAAAAPAPAPAYSPTPQHPLRAPPLDHTPVGCQALPTQGSHPGGGSASTTTGLPPLSSPRYPGANGTPAAGAGRGPFGAARHGAASGAGAGAPSSPSLASMRVNVRNLAFDDEERLGAAQGHLGLGRGEEGEQGGTPTVLGQAGAPELELRVGGVSGGALEGTPPLMLAAAAAAHTQQQQQPGQLLAGGTAASPPQRPPAHQRKPSAPSLGALLAGGGALPRSSALNRPGGAAALLAGLESPAGSVGSPMAKQHLPVLWQAALCTLAQAADAVEACVEHLVQQRQREREEEQHPGGAGSPRASLAAPGGRAGGGGGGVASEARRRAHDARVRGVFCGALERHVRTLERLLGEATGTGGQ